MPENAAKPEPSPFEKMRELAQQVVSTPKSEVDKRDKEWRAKKDAKKKA